MTDTPTPAPDRWTDEEVANGIAFQSTRPDEDATVSGCDLLALLEEVQASRRCRHHSDCAQHNGPAEAPGPCSCGVGGECRNAEWPPTPASDVAALDGETFTVDDERAWMDEVDCPGCAEGRDYYCGGCKQAMCKPCARAHVGCRGWDRPRDGETKGEGDADD